MDSVNNSAVKEFIIKDKNNNNNYIIASSKDVNSDDYVIAPVDFKKQVYDPNYGIKSDYKSLYFTSDDYLIKRIGTFVSLWYDENYNIRILKISHQKQELIWYDYKKELLLRNLNKNDTEYLQDIVDEKPLGGIEIKGFYKIFLRINNFKIRRIIENILIDPKQCYIIPDELIDVLSSDSRL